MLYLGLTHLEKICQCFRFVAPSLGLGLFQRLRRKIVNNSLTNDGVCRTAPATPGLFNINIENMEMYTSFCEVRNNYFRSDKDSDTYF